MAAERGSSAVCEADGGAAARSGAAGEMGVPLAATNPQRAGRSAWRAWWRAESQSAPLGADGRPLSVWQIWLRRLCVVMIAWAILELAFGATFWAVGTVFADARVLDVRLGDIVASVVSTALVGAALNLLIGLLGMRGASNPYKISLFFWITLADAVLTAWAMASNLASGILDLTGTVSGLFIIALAVCTWQVRGQTGYFDEHP